MLAHVHHKVQAKPVFKILLDSNHFICLIQAIQIREIFEEN